MNNHYTHRDMYPFTKICWMIYYMNYINSLCEIFIVIKTKYFDMAIVILVLALWPLSNVLRCVQNISLKITFCGRSMHSLLFAWGHLPSPQSSQVNSSSRRSYGWHSWQCQQQLSPWKKRRVSKHVSRGCCNWTYRNDLI